MGMLYWVVSTFYRAVSPAQNDQLMIASGC